jgi:putative intracellular protease/amidase
VSNAAVDPSGAVYVLVFEGFADWEPAHALAELRRSGNLEVTVVGYDARPVRSMGGLKVVPDTTLKEVDPARVRLLLLPGGDQWEAESPRTELEELVRALLRRGVPVAAICGATLALARMGLLDERRHTSNMADYLPKEVPEYRGQSYYVNALAVREDGIITASGLGSVEFAREIFAELGVMPEADRALWFHVFKHGTFPVSSR